MATMTCPKGFMCETKICGHKEPHNWMPTCFDDGDIGEIMGYQTDCPQCTSFEPDVPNFITKKDFTI